MAYPSAPRRRRPIGLGDLGIQIGPKIRIGGTVGKVGQNVKVAVTKAAVDTGHEVGRAASKPLVQGVTAGVLALTGAGVPLSAAILAAERGGGNLLRPGGNVGKAARGAAEGAAAGVVVGNAGNIVRGAGSLIRGGGSLIKRGAESLVSNVQDTFRRSPGDDTAAPDPNARPLPGVDPVTGKRRRPPITNQTASDVVDAIAKRRGGTSTASGGGLDLAQLLAQLTGRGAAPAPETYAPEAATYPDGAAPSGGLLSSPLVLAAGVGLLFLVTRPSSNRSRR